jgi:Cu+-exporting ATPase
MDHHNHCASCATGQEFDDQAYRSFIIKTSIALVIGFIFIVSMVFNLFPIETKSGYWFNWCAAFITIFVLIYCGGQYFSGAWNSAKQSQANMDTLIALSTGIAWLFSVLILICFKNLPISLHHVYFETAIVIIGLVNLGTIIELSARRRTSNAIEQLMQLQPKTARVIRNNSDIVVAVQDLVINDLIRIKPGDQIPVDGVVVEGYSNVDESMLTGESMPREKKIGDQVIGGTMNKNGSFVMRAKRVGSDTVLASIVDMVQQAQNTKPPLAHLADTIAGYFVPIVILIAIITGLIWLIYAPSPKLTYVLITSMSVLVIACPCALGLAVPISVMVGIGKAAQFGILIRNADALQQCSKITTVILDKTGTLTQGKVSVVGIYPAENFTSNELLLIAAGLESNSEHPYAAAIVETAKNNNLYITNASNFEAIPGLGVSGMLGPDNVSLGNSEMMQAQLVNIDPMKIQARKSGEMAQTVIYVAKNKQLVGMIGLIDPIKPSAAELVTNLKAMNLKVIMITGDTHVTAQAVAKQIGITEVISQVMPAEKASKIDELQLQDEVVAMVGDGINDAPALAKADVSFAIGSGTDIAKQSADIVLTGSSLQGVVTAINISQRTVKNMHQNLFGAFIYNIIGIPIAAGILFPFTGLLLNPMLAGAAMALSSLTVVLNAARLRTIGYRPNSL